MNLRIIKLSKAIFETKEDVINYFTDSDCIDGLLNMDEDIGKFYLHNEIALKSLFPEDHLVFTYLGKVIYYALCSEEIKEYSQSGRYFGINMDSIVRIPDIPVKQIQVALEKIGFIKNIHNQGWSRIENPTAIKVILEEIGLS